MDTWTALHTMQKKSEVKMHKIRKYDSHRLFKFYLDLDDRRQKVGTWFKEISIIYNI